MCAWKVHVYHEILTAKNTSKGKANYITLLTLSNSFLIYPPSTVPMGSWAPGEENCPCAMDVGMGARRLT